MSKGRVLVDMDGVLADFETELANRWRERWPDDDIEQFLNRTQFKFDSLPKGIDSLATKFNEIWSETGFFESMPEIEGSTDAVKTLLDTGYDVRIVTSASNKRKAFSEKANWVHDKLGDHWVRRLVITNDKYFINGDVLIDDRPKVAKGHETDWQQIIYNQPYNQSIDDRPRISWSDEDWLSVIEQTVAQVQADK